MIEIAPSPLADMKVYLDGNGTPEGMVLMNYYQQEKALMTIPEWRPSASPASCWNIWRNIRQR